MARKKDKPVSGTIAYDVVYADGVKSSRRKVSAAEIAEHGEDHARTLIMDQDRKIAEMSGHDRGPILSITRSED